MAWLACCCLWLMRPDNKGRAVRGLPLPSTATLVIHSSLALAAAPAPPTHCQACYSPCSSQVRSEVLGSKISVGSIDTHSAWSLQRTILGNCTAHSCPPLYHLTAFTSTTTGQMRATVHTCAFVLFLILKGPSCSIPEGCLQQGLENCPYGFTGPARYTLPWAAPEASVKYKLDQTT